MKQGGKCVLALFAGAVLMSPGAFGQTPGDLTLMETFRIVHEQNPTLQGARYDLAAVREQYPQAMAGWYPRISAEANLISTNIETGNFSSGDGATTKGASVNLEQPVFRGFRTLAEVKSAEERIEAAEHNLMEREQAVFSDVARAYVMVLRNRQLLVLEEKNRDLLSGDVDAVKARFEAGDTTMTDVQQTEGRLADAKARAAIAQSRLDESNTMFEELTGFVPPEHMAMPEPDFTYPETEDGLVAMAEAANPTLAAVRHESLAAESDIRAVRSDLYPQLTAFASYIKERDPQPGIVAESSTGTIGLRARMALYEGGSTMSRIREAKARASGSRVDIVAADRAVKSALIADWKKLRASDEEIAAREIEVNAARLSVQGVREEARLGERTVFDVLEGEQDVLDAETDLVEARIARVITSYRLAGTLGFLTARALGFEGAASAPLLSEPVVAPAVEPVEVPFPALVEAPPVSRLPAQLPSLPVPAAAPPLTPDMPVYIRRAPGYSVERSY